ncbi:LRR 8 domain containing protein [Asbolus verrucosus]|uniref:LRR 8 domain containing protein n=1 Tax=Asbolus verrucosus TaxID=1661398 RepID=A0A482V618_ASBVE|nr:LRR 8 domain containing protein [Asbolus verrucosus]
MEYNLVQELPADAFGYFVNFYKGHKDVKLWYLVLSDNKLEKIHPDAFKGLTEVAYLNLHNNSIQELPPGVFRTVKYINNLVLSDNKIIDIDVPQVFKNTKLTYVTLENNQLSCLPVDIFNITKIYNLKLDGNPLGCECVKSWEMWQNQTGKNIVSFDNIRESCIQ